MTEMAGVITVLSPADHRDAAHPERLASAGTPIPGPELRVVDPATGRTSPRAPASSGSAPPQRMPGYLGPARRHRRHHHRRRLAAHRRHRPRSTTAAIVFIVDRVKDMIITGGENVYSPEVERVARRAPRRGRRRRHRRPDDRWGESVKAVVAPAPGHTVDPAELIAYSRQRLAGYKCPRAVDVVDALPRNATGKILKRSCAPPTGPVATARCSPDCESDPHCEDGSHSEISGDLEEAIAGGVDAAQFVVVQHQTVDAAVGARVRAWGLIPGRRTRPGPGPAADRG